MGKFKYIEKQEYKYKVIPEKKIVVCECYVELNWYNLPQGIWNYIPSDICKKIFKFNDSFPKFKVRAVAKTHPNDVFNEEIGKRIAKSKANLKLYRIIEKCFAVMRNFNTKVYIDIDRCHKDIIMLNVMEHNHLKELSK